MNAASNTPLNSGEGGHPQDRPQYFLSAMFAYLGIVYLYGLLLHPLGRDYALMGGAVEMPRWATLILQAQMTVFGGFFPGYYLCNLLLLYVCMVCIFFLTRFVVGGPWWLGSLAAVLTMAHPLKSDAVLHATGAVVLLPVVVLLLVLTLQAATLYYDDPRYRYAALGWFPLALFLSPASLPLLGVMGLLGYCHPHVCARQPWHCAIITTVYAIASAIWWHEIWATWTWDFGQRFGALLLVFYPIGLMPETTARFIEYTVLGWITAFLVVGLLLGVVWRTKSKALGLMLLGAVFLRFTPLEQRVDWVHLLGGGTMILPIALCAVAFSAFCLAVMQHPKWRRPVVFMTTLLCVVFFIMQISAIHHWRTAGFWVRSLQAAVQEEKMGAPTFTPFFLFPDLQYYRGAPYQPAAGLRYDTPFSQHTDFLALLPLHAATYNEIEYHVNTAEAGKLRLELLLDDSLLHYLPENHAIDSYVLKMNAVYPISITQYTDHLWEIVVMEGETPFPEHRVALPQEWYEDE